MLKEKFIFVFNFNLGVDMCEFTNFSKYAIADYIGPR